jgi:hypothetical protein
MEPNSNDNTDGLQAGQEGKVKSYNMRTKRVARQDGRVDHPRGRGARGRGAGRGRGGKHESSKPPTTGEEPETDDTAETAPTGRVSMG